jgi:hypothetical protein
MEKPLPVHLLVPVRPAVEKYLRRKLHLRPEQAFQLTKKGSVGRILYHLLRSPEQDRQYSASVQEYPGRFSVSISPQHAWLKSCRYLTDQGVHDFNRQVEDLLEQEFHIKLDTLAEAGVKFETKVQALRFMDHYGFTEDDLTLDALLKSYYRYRIHERNALLRLAGAIDIPNCPAEMRLVA